MTDKITIVQEDAHMLFCVKPVGLSCGEGPGSILEKLEQQGYTSLFVVHRLDQAVGGLMVLAKDGKTAAVLNKQIQDGTFEKEYEAIAEGSFEDKNGRMEDFLFRDRLKNKTYVVARERKGVRLARLAYSVLGESKGFARVRVKLFTGRTHQIRAQFSHRKHPLVGDRKYGSSIPDCPIALWSCSIKTPTYSVEISPPEDQYPWNLFHA